MLSDFNIFILVIIFLLQLFIWYIFLKKSGFIYSEINIFNILFYFILIFQYFGFIYIFLLAGYKFSNSEAIVAVFFNTSITISYLILGSYVARFFLSKSKIFKLFKEKFDTVIIPESASIIFLLVLISISAIYFSKYLYIVGFDNIAFLKLIGMSENPHSVAFLRSEMGNNFPGKYHWYRLFIRDFMYLSSSLIFSLYLTNPKINKVPIAIAIFLLAFASSVIAAEKQPVSELLIFLFFTYLLIKNEGRITFKKMITISMIILGIISVFYYFLGQGDLHRAMISTANRVFIAQMEGLYYYMEIFPTSIEFLAGRSFPNPAGIFPWEPYRLAVGVAEIVSGANNSGIVGSMPTFYWGEMYANFGLAGVLIPPFFIGFLIRVVDFLFNNQKKKIILVPIYIWFIFHYKDLAMTGLSKFLIDINLFSIIGTLMISIWLSKIYLKLKISTLK